MSSEINQLKQTQNWHELVLKDKVIKTAIIIVFYVFKELRRDMKDKKTKNS